MDPYQIYYLNADPVKCAQAHTDEHVKTQCFEIGMLLSYAYRCQRDDPQTLAKIYSPSMTKDSTYYNWLAPHEENCKWLHKMWSELFNEHEYRFDKVHVSKPMLEIFKDTRLYRNPWRCINNDLSVPPCLVPEEYQQDHNKKPYKSIDPRKRSTLNSYRNWYTKEFIKEPYTKRECPEWAKQAFINPAPAVQGIQTTRPTPPRNPTRNRAFDTTIAVPRVRAYDDDIIELYNAVQIRGR